MNTFIFSIKFKHNLQNFSHIFKFPIVGQYHHEIFYKTLQTLNKNIAKLIYSQKPYKDTTAYISKNHLTITTINAEIGNSLIEALNKPQNIEFNLHVNLPKPGRIGLKQQNTRNTKLSNLSANNLTDEPSKQKPREIAITLTKLEAKINFIAHLIDAYAQGRQQELEIFIRTPLLISPRYHYDRINYLVKTSIKKVYSLFDDKDYISSELYHKKLYTDLYKLTFLQLKSKLFSPLEKQSYHGVYGKLKLVTNPTLATILKLASLTNTGLKASYGYGHMHVK